MSAQDNRIRVSNELVKVDSNPLTVTMSNECNTTVNIGTKLNNGPAGMLGMKMRYNKKQLD